MSDATPPDRPPASSSPARPRPAPPAVDLSHVVFPHVPTRLPRRPRDVESERDVDWALNWPLPPELTNRTDSATPPSP